MILLATATVTTKASGPKQELLLEQRRLTKLWDAFKQQELEFRAIERERDDLWERVQELEKATEGLGSPTQTLAKLQRYDEENQRLRADVADLGQRLEKNRQQFHEEQERLAKLFKVYEDAESRLGDAWKELRAWHAWWEKHGSSVPPKAAAAAKKIQRAK